MEGRERDVRVREKLYAALDAGEAETLCEGSVVLTGCPGEARSGWLGGNRTSQLEM